jgi:glyoxylate utilization-related uncharacterized protein
MTQPRTIDRDDLAALRVLSAGDVDGIPWMPLRGLTGVTQKVLWQAGDIVIGLIRVEGGHDKPAHAHDAAYHHIWIVSGSCTMVGQPLTAGAYVYVPPGVDHEVGDVGAEGCVYFYTHRPLQGHAVRGSALADAVSAE